MRCIHLALLSLSLLGCVPETGARSAPIVEGTREFGEEAVVLVKVAGGVASCTGTLVSENVVLTAKHCVQLQGLEDPYPVGLVSIGIGHDRNTDDYRARRIDTTPGAYGAGLSGLVGEDVAVITIRPDDDGNFPDVLPIDYRRESPADLVGEEVTFIGFGQTETGASGLKYTRTGTVNAVSGSVITSAGNICQGDSGGPMILEGSPRQIVGVASFGRSATGDSCPAIQDGHNAIDGFLGIIDLAILEAGGCPFDGATESCNSIDDDCDGTTDEGCAALGDACTADDECAYAQLPEYFGTGLFGLLEDPVVCGGTPAGRVCTRGCDPLRPLTSCSTAENPFGGPTPVAIEPGLCVSTGGCEGTCVARGAHTADLEAICTDDAECATGRCVDPGDGARRCLQPCMGDAAQCAAGEACAAAPAACGACVDEGLISGPRGFGEGCGGAGDCRSGVCEGGVCSRACVNNRDCGETFHCAGSVCRPGPGGDSGDLCSDSADCLSSRTCVPDPGVCAVACSGDSCSDGFACSDGFCVPATAVLGESCTADTDCFDGLCVDGACTRECGVEGACPVGLECRREDSGRGLCRAPEDDGCSAAGSPRGGLLALLLLGFALRRRRG